MESKRRETGHHHQALVDVVKIDFTALSKVSMKHVCSMMGLSTVSIHISQSNCVGISGDWVVKQDVSQTGTTNSDMVEGALVIASGVSTYGQVTKATLTMEYVVIELPTTLPASGTATITITGKAH